MYVCLCKGITDSQIKHCVKSGANSLHQVRKELGAATQCCKCLPEVRSIVSRELDAQEESNACFTPSPLFFPA